MSSLTKLVKDFMSLFGSVLGLLLVVVIVIAIFIAGLELDALNFKMNMWIYHLLGWSF